VKQFLITSLLATSLLSNQLQASSCTSKVDNDSSRLTGTAEAASYEEAKALAIADALSFLGIKIKSTIQIKSDNNGSNMSQDVLTEVSAVAQGFEVLSRCSKPPMYEVIVGVSKTLLFRLLEARATARNVWLQETLQLIDAKNPAKITSDRDLKSFLAEEKDDLESWMILGKNKASFKEMPRSDVSRLQQSVKSSLKAISIKAGDDTVANKTLHALVSKLRSLGLKATMVKTASDGVEVSTWNCVTTRGLPMGRAIRFQTECSLELDIGPNAIQVSGISTEENIEDQAIRLIIDRISQSL
jgi:hypothetical protein